MPEIDAEKLANIERMMLAFEEFKNNLQGDGNIRVNGGKITSRKPSSNPDPYLTPSGGGGSSSSSSSSSSTTLNIKTVRAAELDSSGFAVSTTQDVFTP